MKKYGWIPLAFIYGLAVGSFAPSLPIAIIAGGLGGVILQQLWFYFVEEK